MKATGSSDRNREICPEGTYGARVFFMVDLGTHTEQYGKQEPKARRKVRIAFELPECLMENGKPFAVGHSYNMNLGPAPQEGKPAPNFVNQLCVLIKAATGKDVPINKRGDYEFDLEQLIGKEVLVQVGRNANGNEKIVACMPLPKGMQVGIPFNKPFVLSLEESEFSLETFMELTPFWQKLIQESPEGQKLNLDQLDQAELDRAHERTKEERKSGQSAKASTPDDDIPF